MDLSKADLRPYSSYEISEATVLKKKWGFRVRLIYEDGTDKVCQHSGFMKKESANKARNEIIAYLHMGIYVAYTNVRVKDLLVFWLENVMRVKKDFTANSYDSYRNCIDNHIIPKIGNIKLLELNQGHVTKLYKELSQKYTSIPKIAKPILNTSMKYALSKQLILKNPCEGVNLPKKVKRNEYHTIKIKETQAYTLEQVKILLKASKESKIHMQILFAVLMGLRKGEINGLKYSDVDFERRKLKVRRQLGRDLHKDKGKLEVNTITKQEVKLKTRSSEREIDIPNYVFEEIVKEKKLYEKRKSRRQHGKWTFQDLGYICCSSYGRPRSKDYHYPIYKQLLEEIGLPYIRFHDLRHTYTTLLLKNDINQKAVAAALGHSKSIITVDTYGDTQTIIEGGVEVMQEFIDEVHPYDEQDVQMLKEKFGIERKVNLYR